MLRPFQEYAAPRHILQDTQLDDDNPLREEPVALPEVSVFKQDSAQVSCLLVVPEVLGVLSEALVSLGRKSGEIRQVGSVKVAYPELEDTEMEPEFDEDTQLYKARGNVLLRHDSKDVAIYRLGHTTFLTVPDFHNKITYNLLANTLLETYDIESVVAVGTSELNGNGLVNKLVRGYTTASLDFVPDMQPPNIVTGAPAAFVARAALLNVPVLALAVDAEGAFNIDMEKLNLDAALAGALALNKVLHIDSTGLYEQLVRARLDLKSASSGGLYV